MQKLDFLLAKLPHCRFHFGQRPRTQYLQQYEQTGRQKSAALSESPPRQQSASPRLAAPALQNARPSEEQSAPKACHSSGKPPWD